jgi:hypothetical protein
MLTICSTTKYPKDRLQDWWNRIVNFNVSVRSLDDASPSDVNKPSLAVELAFMMLKQYLLRPQNETSVELQLQDHDAKVINTSVGMLNKVLGNNRSYYEIEPLLMESAFSCIKKGLRFGKMFMVDYIKSLISLASDARGKEFDRFIAVRFRLGWWLEIDKNDLAELPDSVRTRILQLKDTPKYVAFERKVSDMLLETTFCDLNSNTYVLPAEKSGLDGCFRSICYLGKTSAVCRNLKDQQYVSSGERRENVLYTDLDEWFSGLPKQRAGLIRKFKHLNSKVPVVFFCSYFPFFGPSGESLPQIVNKGENIVVHVDLTSKLGCYMIGKECLQAWMMILSDADRKRVNVPEKWKQTVQDDGLLL